MSRKGKKDFAYHLSRFLSVYLPGQRNVSENTVLSYKDTFKLIDRAVEHKNHPFPCEQGCVYVA